jgi:hypothetical protein
MAALSAASSAVSAYQREASRLIFAAPPVGGKRITRDASVSLGPFSFHYSATDYEFDLTGASAQTSFPDALDAAATVTQLAEAGGVGASGSNAGDAGSAPSALSRRLALDGYRAAAQLRPVSVSLFQAQA